MVRCKLADSFMFCYSSLPPVTTPPPPTHTHISPLPQHYIKFRNKSRRKDTDNNESSQDCVSRGGEMGSSLAGLGFLTATWLFSTVVSSDTVFVTFFPTTIETLTTPVSAIFTFYRFGGQVSLCDWRET